VNARCHHLAEPDSCTARADSWQRRRRRRGASARTDDTAAIQAIKTLGRRGPTSRRQPACKTSCSPAAPGSSRTDSSRCTIVVVAEQYGSTGLAAARVHIVSERQPSTIFVSTCDFPYAYAPA